jgi:hypothetical protein
MRWFRFRWTTVLERHGWRYQEDLRTGERRAIRVSVSAGPRAERWLSRRGKPPRPAA